MTQKEMLASKGLDWRVSKEPIQTVSGIYIPDQIALVREDTQAVLGIHTEGYDPYQNEELLDLLYKISNQSGLEVHTGGCFQGGKLVWFQLKSDEYTLGTDKIRGFISGMNGFNGRHSLAFGNSNVTISCMNTFWRAYRQVETRLRHSAQMRPKIDEILRRIDVLLEEEKKGFDEIRRLNNEPMTPEVRELVTKMLFSLDKEEKLAVGELSTNKQNKMIRFNADVDMELSTKDRSLWGLFSGVTRYTTHDMKKGDNSESKMFGRTGGIERKIYKELVEMV
jgi:phage/plasmid-like protein (TIGR03299 family)